MNYSHPAIALPTEPGDAEQSYPPVALPRVNVIITSFNYAKYVGQALDSVAAQTYPEFDCVIVDDASTDDSAAVVERWLAAHNDPRFKLVRSTTNGGQMASFAAGLAASQGEFVAFLDADDIWFPQFLQRHIEVHLNRVQYAGASCSDLVQIDSEGRALSGITKSQDFQAKVLVSNFYSFKAAEFPRFDPDRQKLAFTEASEVKYYFPSMNWHFSVTAGMMFRRALVELLIPKDCERVRICADFYIMVFCHYFTGSLVIEDAFGGYRRHGKNNFSNLPVVGAHSAFSPLKPHMQINRNTFEVMLRHLLDCYDTFASSFPESKVRSLVRYLFRQFLLAGMPFHHPQLVKTLGSGRVLRDRVRAKVKFLRRGLR